MMIRVIRRRVHVISHAIAVAITHKPAHRKVDDRVLDKVRQQKGDDVIGRLEGPVDDAVVVLAVQMLLDVRRRTEVGRKRFGREGRDAVTPRLGRPAVGDGGRGRVRTARPSRKLSAVVTHRGSP